MNLPSVNILLLLPLAVTSAAVVVALMLDVFGDEREKRWIAPASLIALGLAAVLALSLNESSGLYTASGFHRVDWLSIVGMVSALLAAAGTIFMTMARGERDPKVAEGEYYALALLSTAGVIVVCGANELVTMLIGVELASLSLYALAGFHFSDKRSNEAALKYFMLGALASALMVYGLAFLYGATGTTVLTEMGARLRDGRAAAPGWLGLGATLMLAGFCFKLALAPFHMYAPDVYEGAPTPIASLIATGGKIAGFVGLWRILDSLIVPGLGYDFSVAKDAGFRIETLLALVALLSVIIGNLGAFTQTNLKRLLAYSSVAHAGYAALAYVALANARVSNEPALAIAAGSALRSYLVAYTLMNLLAFAAVSVLGRDAEQTIRLRGAGRRHPLAATALAAALISLTGLPPTVGFFAKWQVFLAAARADYAWLALIAAVMSIFSAYYYLRPVALMFFSEEPADRQGAADDASEGLAWPPVRAVLGVASGVALLLGPALLYL